MRKVRTNFCLVNARILLGAQKLVKIRSIRKIKFQRIELAPTQQFACGPRVQYKNLKPGRGKERDREQETKKGRGEGREFAASFPRENIPPSPPPAKLGALSRPYSTLYEHCQNIFSGSILEIKQ
jgi:hypothetical protein